MKVEIVSGYPDIHFLIFVIGRLRQADGHHSSIVVKLTVNLKESYVTVGKVFTMDHSLSNLDRLDITETIDQYAFGKFEIP